MASPDAIACTGPRLAGGARQQGPGVRGRLRVYLGVAPGAGATCMLLREGHGRAARGADVVVASVATHGRPGTARLLAGLEVVPPAAAALLTFVRADNATQLVLGTGHRSWRSAVRPKGRIISRVIRGSTGTDVHIVTTRTPRTVRPHSGPAQSTKSGSVYALVGRAAGRIQARPSAAAPPSRTA
jgi:K+-sensing histidine kinase KdpD